jgi:hypothetical protein
VLGLRTYARMLAGEAISHADEVEGSYGERPAYTDESVFSAAHERLEELLPGDGPPAERYQRWQDSLRVPREQVERTLAAVIEEARRLGASPGRAAGRRRSRPGDRERRALVGVLRLPRRPAESDRAQHRFADLGDRAARPRDSRDVSRSPHGALQQGAPARARPRAARGDAGDGADAADARHGGDRRLAPYLLLESDGGAALAAALQGAGIELDLAHAVERVLEPCRWAEANVALMLHDAGASEAEALAYLQRWALLTPEWAAHMIRFITEPTQRTYIHTYAAGRELCRSYVAGEPERFRRLLAEQMRVRDLLAARDGDTGSVLGDSSADP